MKALKIKTDTYPIYLALMGTAPAMPLQRINNLFLVYDPDLPLGPWGWFEERDFRSFYRFVGDPLWTDFTKIIPLEEKP